MAYEGSESAQGLAPGLTPDSLKGLSPEILALMSISENIVLADAANAELNRLITIESVSMSDTISSDTLVQPTPDGFQPTLPSAFSALSSAAAVTDQATTSEQAEEKLLQAAENIASYLATPAEQSYCVNRILDNNATQTPEAKTAIAESIEVRAFEGLLRGIEPHALVRLETDGVTLLSGFFPSEVNAPTQPINSTTETRRQPSGAGMAMITL